VAGERQGEPESEQERSEDRARRAFSQTAAFGFVLLVVSLLCQLPTGWGPASVRQHGDGFALLWHQGWDFFTSETQEVPVAYRPATDGRAPTLISAPLASTSDAWGADRVNSLTMIETELLAAQVPSADWRPCGNPAGGLCPADPSAHAYVLHDGFSDSAVCGLVELVIEAPRVSASAGSEVRQPLRESTVEVLCAS
jgi:hypothetical protein